MIPKLHAKGTSFKGAAAYLLHDKGSREKNERVEWTQTRNLATERPDAAWRVMAATAMDADRRKAVAGIKATGRKSKDSVLHLTLSWHPDEAGKVNRKEMMRAADGALAALGAGDRQVLIVCHNDEPQPHVHLLINRVSAEDGRMLSSSKEKLALSKWAQGYEQEHGRVVCPERVENNARRARGEFVRGKRDRARSEFEDDRPQLTPLEAKSKKLLDDERRRNKELAEKGRAMKDRHRDEWRSLERKHRREKRTVGHSVRELFPRYKLRVERVYDDRRAKLDRKQWEDFKAFKTKETTTLGRMINRFQTINFATLVKNAHGERSTLKDAVRCVRSSSARMEAFRQKQRRERRELDRSQNRRNASDKKRIFLGWRIRRERVHKTFGRQRAELVMRHKGERHEQAMAWRRRKAEEHEVKTKLFIEGRPERDRKWAEGVLGEIQQLLKDRKPPRNTPAQEKSPAIRPPKPRTQDGDMSRLAEGLSSFSFQQESRSVKAEAIKTEVSPQTIVPAREEDRPLTVERSPVSPAIERPKVEPPAPAAKAVQDAPHPDRILVTPPPAETASAESPYERHKRIREEFAEAQRLRGYGQSQGRGRGRSHRLE